MKKMLSVLVVMLFLFPAAGLAKKKDKDLMGLYSVSGFNPGMSTSGEPSYTGTLEITQSGGAYMLQWNLDGKEKKNYNGVGIFSDGILSVGYNGGVVSYKVKKNALKGVWAPLSGGVFGFEICQKR